MAVNLKLEMEDPNQCRFYLKFIREERFKFILKYQEKSFIRDRSSKQK